MLDSDDLEFFQIVARALRISDAEYEYLIETNVEYASFEDTAEDEDVSEERVSEYELDPFWPDDEWLDAGEEWELAPDYGED